MIKIRIGVDNNGVLRSILAEGHSETAGKGNNIICAAVSAQIRGLVTAVAGCADCSAVIAADRDGFLDMKITSCGRTDWLCGVTDVVLSGLLKTEQEYPDECSIKLIKLS